MVSAEALGFHTQTRGHTAPSHRTGPLGGNQVQARGPQRLLLRLGGGDLGVAGSNNIGVEALVAQLIIQGGLTHACHRRDALDRAASTSCGQPTHDCAAKVHTLWTFWGQARPTRTLAPTGSAA